MITTSVVIMTSPCGIERTFSSNRHCNQFIKLHNKKCIKCRNANVARASTQIERDVLAPPVNLFSEIRDITAIVEALENYESSQLNIK